MGGLNVIPFFGWSFSLIFNISLAIPFWIAWTACGIGEEYFYFLPDRYLRPGFWACVGFFMCVSILNCFVPKIASVSNSNETKSK